MVELCQPVDILLHPLYCCRYICAAISGQHCFTLFTHDSDKETMNNKINKELDRSQTGQDEGELVIKMCQAQQKMCLFLKSHTLLHSFIIQCTCTHMCIGYFAVASNEA